MGAFFSMSGTMTYRTRLPRMKMCSMWDTWRQEGGCSRWHEGYGMQVRQGEQAQGSARCRESVW